MENTITIPSGLEGFTNIKTAKATTVTDRTIFLIDGTIQESEEERACPKCGTRMHVHDTYDVSLSHIPLGRTLSAVRFEKRRYICPECHATSMQGVPFQAGGHRITAPLYSYARDLLELGLTNKNVSELTGLCKNTVKDIDKERLLEKYTTDGKHLRKPERQSRYLGVDEFLLHKGHEYATIIIDLETGHVLWLAHGKKKQALYDFIDFVGEDWMDGVEAVACDMNSDYQDVFEDRCPHIQVVFDFFHIRKNFNDKVVAEVRKDEQRRLYAEGKIDEAKMLKGSKYILTANRKTLRGKDEKAREGNGNNLEGKLFDGGKPKATRGGNEELYDALLKENRLLSLADIVKEKLSHAYTLCDECAMAKEITEIIDICLGSGNKHFKWFARLLENHFEGITAHGTYKISSGKVEGTNNLIKTVRRRAYGYRDNDYFFLKILDESRREYVRNPKSHKLYD
ncbi:MAG: ISL3 family transposase [Candidatus Ornithospirochaeta sp.]